MIIPRMRTEDTETMMMADEDGEDKDNNGNESEKGDGTKRNASYYGIEPKDAPSQIDWPRAEAMFAASYLQSLSSPYRFPYRYLIIFSTSSTSSNQVDDSSSRYLACSRPMR